jgi:hypothetical protein
MTDTELVRAIEGRYVAVCRELVRAEGAYSDRLAYEALEIAVGEHAGDLRRHPEIAAAYTVDLAGLAPHDRAGS